MTEDEAKKKICQETFARPNGEFWCCIGSACMAWRFHADPIEDEQGRICGWKVSEHGYCGKAGVPTR